MSTVLITGASGGIGYELAKLFARDHHNLVLVARSGDKLVQVAAELRTRDVTVKTIALDLATSLAPKFLFDQLQTDGLAVDILINNAGFGAFGEFAQMSNDEIFGQIQLNIIALTELTRLFLPPMLARRSGRIMNVASTAGFQPGPLMAVYYATKAYVISFTEALANEVRNSGVTVTCFCPGATHTGFAKRAGNDKSRLFKQLGATVTAPSWKGARSPSAALIIGWSRNPRDSPRASWLPQSPAGFQNQPNNHKGHEGTRRNISLFLQVHPCPKWPMFSFVNLRGLSG
jgi:short-subunit dehydrogenase